MTWVLAHILKYYKKNICQKSHKTKSEIIKITFLRTDIGDKKR